MKWAIVDEQHGVVLFSMIAADTTPEHPNSVWFTLLLDFKAALQERLDKKLVLKPLYMMDPLGFGFVESIQDYSDYWAKELKEVIECKKKQEKE